jgi:hypothetical protein
VIAVTVVITVLVVGKDSGDGSPTPSPTNGGGSDFASANDNGPVAIITEDPTCAGWNRTLDGLAAEEQKVAWGSREKSISVSAWTPELRTTYETVGRAMSKAADQTAGLAKATPHRVVRELYAQFGAYARAFNEKLPGYTADDTYLAEVVDGIAATLMNICAAISYDVAAAQAPLLPHVAPPSTVAAPDDNPSSSPRFLSETNPICTEWESTYEKFDADTAAWRELPVDVPAEQWTPEERAINEAVAPVMTTFADDIEQLGRRSDNPIVEDFAVLSSQYRRAYVLALSSSTSIDNYLANASTNLVKTVYLACKGAGR